jgi:hypothetical protein
MKAKMPRGQKAPETADYLCIWCDETFHYEYGQLACPSCGNSTRSDLVPIFMEEDPKEEVLYVADEFHGG